MLEQLRPGDQQMPDGAIAEQNHTRLSFPAPGSRAFDGRRVLIVGTGPLAGNLCDELETAAGPVVIVGAIDSVPQPYWSSYRSQVPVLGGLEDLQSVILAQCIDEVHVALPIKSHYDQFSTLAEESSELGIPTTFHLSILEEGSRPALKGANKLVVYGPHSSTRGLHRAVKRALDVIMSLTALTLLAPLFVVIALAIKLTSTGPVFFRQPRIGLGRRQFGMLKFRTMIKNAEELRSTVQALNNARGISFKVFRDPRVTRVGSLLRRTSLDELPQLLNVLRGEMSMVGPRPIPVWVAEQLEANAQFRRFSVMPGLTGLWQVEGREQDFDRMSVQDLRYIDNWDFSLDFKILAKTLPAVLRGEGAH